MRIYQTLHETVKEIHRDLSRAPKIKSDRVQNQYIGGLTAEWTNYSYAVMSSGIPHESSSLAKFGYDHFPTWQEFSEEIWERWLEKEISDRISGRISLGIPAENIHPFLCEMEEGHYYSYTYADRLLGWLPVMVDHLRSTPSSRRAFWPIFQPQDAIRAVWPTRVPCTLGYHWMIRPFQDEKLLECTLIQRSVDFEKYWLSDIWFAYRMTHRLFMELYGLDAVDGIGNINHQILSFHRFIDDSEETY